MTIKYAAAITLFLFTTAFVSPAHSAGEPVIFGVYTSDKPTTMHAKFKPILMYLEDELRHKGLDISIELKIYPSYSEAVEALAGGKYDFSRFGPASYIMAKQKQPGIRLLAMEHKNNTKRFNGVFIAPENSPITSLRDLNGKRFAFGDKNSTIGRYLSQAELVKAGIRGKDLGDYQYLGRHDKVAVAVAAGNYDAGVVKENTFKKYAASRGLKNIGVFPNVTKPWVARADLDDGLFAALQAALLSLDDKTVLKSLKQDGFLPATDADYDFVRKGMELARDFEN